MNIKLLPRKAAAFTIVEIAIALGVIGFALVAIVGILPTGLNVERANREETLINQDGPYFLEAVRGGAHGLNILTSFVDSITITEVSNSTKYVTTYTNSPGLTVPNWNGNMTNSQWIIGLLCWPKYLSNGVVAANGFTNRVDARVRAMSGSAVEQRNISKDVTFGYSIYSEVVPVNFHAFQGNTNGSFALTNDLYSSKLQANLFEVRLNFRWPLLPNGDIGNGRKIYRTYVSGQIPLTNAPDGTPLFLFRQDNFASLR
jgi:hypothetical protein